jgi:aspartate racemase
MPCNSATVFADQVQRSVSIPLISIVDVSVEAASRYGVSSVGILATDGCIASGIFQQALEDEGINAVLPEDSQIRLLMDLIGEIKAGRASDCIAEKMQSVAEELRDRGADAIISACTEIPLVLSQDKTSIPLVSSTDQLAQRTVDLALGTVRLSA